MSLESGPEDSGAVPETCAEARRQIAGFVHPRPGREEGRFLRAHLDRCPDCATAYRDALAGAARVGRAVREERVEREREHRHAELVRLARSAGSATYGGRSGLKLFLATCALFFLFTRLPLLGFGAALRAERAVGQVVAAGSALGADARIKLARGDRCLTGVSASVVLVHGDVELRLGANTHVLVEDSARGGPRVRFLAGTLELAGSCVVTTELGVLTLLRGHARVELDGGLWVACSEGEASFVGPLGARRLGAGESATFGLEG